MKEVLFIRGKREAYIPYQCDKTMTVGELKELLEYYDEDTPIYLNNDNGYTFGSVTKDAIWLSEEEFEDAEER